MKREIKFRAWNGRFMLDAGYGDWVSFDGVPYTEADRYNSPNIEVRKAKDYILMQYTGLKDKNGRDVFEGDIVNLHPEDNDKIWHRVIEWDTAAFHCRAIHTDANHPLHFHKFSPDKNWIVIGNIYTNPELLTK